MLVVCCDWPLNDLHSEASDTWNSLSAVLTAADFLYCGSLLFMPNHVRRGLGCGRDSGPVASNVSDTLGRLSRDDSTGGRGSLTSPTARQTGRAPKRARVLVGIPRNGLPDICTGVCGCCNKPRSWGSRRIRAALRPHFPRTPAGAPHMRLHRAVRQRSGSNLSARLRRRRIVQTRFCRSPLVWFYS